ncbi:transposase [Corallococcus exiguus]|uniref:transposase n=1 Tax=Corallococcus exiguus TaxID=83462 RepID=UPI00345B01F8
MGRSRGGFSTKVHAVTTTGGKPLHLALTAGQQHESTMAEELLVHAEGDAFLADTGYDAERIRANAQKVGMKPVIHPHPSRKQPPPRGVHLPRPQTLSRRRHPLRQDRDLPPRRLARRSHGSLAALIRDNP